MLGEYLTGQQQCFYFRIDKKTWIQTSYQSILDYEYNNFDNKNTALNHLEGSMSLTKVAYPSVAEILWQLGISGSFIGHPELFIFTS